MTTSSSDSNVGSFNANHAATQIPLIQSSDISGLFKYAVKTKIQSINL